MINQKLQDICGTNMILEILKFINANKTIVNDEFDGQQLIVIRFNLDSYTT